MWQALLDDAVFEPLTPRTQAKRRLIAPPALVNLRPLVEELLLTVSPTGDVVGAVPPGVPGTAAAASALAPRCPTWEEYREWLVNGVKMWHAAGPDPRKASFWSRRREGDLKNPPSPSGIH